MAARSQRGDEAALTGGQCGALWGIHAGLVPTILLIATQAHQLQDLVLDEPESVLSIFARQLVQPLTW